MDTSHKTSMEEVDFNVNDSLLQQRPIEAAPKRHQKQNRVLITALALVTIIVASTAFIFWSIVSSSKSCPNTLHATKDSRVLHCGSSPSEARSLGCKLQIWSYSWVPEPCFDAELNEEFITIHIKDDLPYYADRNGTEVVDFDVVYEGNLELLYTVWGSHYWHCAFMMRKFFRRRAAFTESTWEYEHVAHCQMWLANPFRFDFKRVTTKAGLVYSTCVPGEFEGFTLGNFETIE
ncbi:hypothetical protein G7054_g11200 [Neopestalotiopsis clavispora]|nr:hypothetical protein G7054_g11200 [Neopestalotiopsis clavispora]